MSPRAAWRLEGLGFSEAYDYAPSKVDWFAAGLPMEGELSVIPTVGDAARKDVPTCAPAESVGEVHERIRGTGWDRCVVVLTDLPALPLAFAAGAGTAAILSWAWRRGGPQAEGPRAPRSRARRAEADPA